MRWMRFVASVACAVLPVMALSGCGGSDGQFDVDIHASAPDVLSALEDPELAQVQEAFPEAKILRSRPSDSELLFTIPGDNPDQTITVRFTLTPQAGDAHTDVKVTLHVPPVPVSIKGRSLNLSEMLVQNTLHSSLDELDKAMQGQMPSGPARSELAQLIGALAIAAHPALVSELTSDKDGEKIRERLALIGGMGDDNAGQPEDPAPQEAQATDVRPDARPTGTDPRPTEAQGDGAEPMTVATGTAARPTE